ncbi:patatin-like phospholipase family protein [Thermoflavimicrobium dichotomicum]|uniref:NTE family protein n=1 Tax=Thermoflavimicrobium dichotomicum TaxID=46223 RepID=A0A1I3QCM1_9BACL|nr:patatin-like phospholipase family protein [Thermoflavimicrobium dichotomicum]SFJ31893.1 NTE family protein [Thermoflavimicrobium dichotomicum]
MWADAVFEGGGVKGIGLVGALSVAEKKGFRWKRVAGTSAGAVIASLIAAGYTADELYQILMEKNFLDFLSPNWFNQIPYIGPLLRIWLKKGMYSGDALEKWLASLLKAKGIETFSDFQGDTELHVIASDITLSQLLVLPDDLINYGYKKEEISVARAVRMSASIPYFFQPVKIRHQSHRTHCYIVDGGVLSNFPVWLFDQEEPRWPTFGFCLVSSSEKKINRIDGPFSMLMSIFFTMLEAHDNRAIQGQDQLRTIMVPSMGIKITDFSLNREQKEQLFRSGQKAAEAFFRDWTFEQYLQVRGKRN